MAKTKSEKIILEAKKRELFGKKVKKLRREGKIPANIFGRNFKSTAISIEAGEFSRVYRLAGRTNVIYIKLDNKELPVLVSQIQRHPLTDFPIHVDFKKVDLKQKVEAEVPVKITGASPAVEEKGAEVIVQSKTLLVEALPDKIPAAIEVDISSVTEPGVEIKVKDLKAGKDWEFAEEPEKTVVVIAAHVTEEVEPEKPSEEAPAEESEKKKEEEKKEEGKEEGGEEKKE